MRLLLATASTTVAGLLLSCEHQVTEYPHQPELVSEGSVTQTYLVVHWVRSVDEIVEACNSTGTWYACARWRIHPEDPTTSSCTIWALRPRSFNDIVRLAILGHELWHCLGATHK